MGVPDDPFDPKLKQWIAWAARLAAEVALAAISLVGVVVWPAPVRTLRRGRNILGTNFRISERTSVRSRVVVG